MKKERKNQIEKERKTEMEYILTLRNRFLV